jgi:hypothetical protein
MSDLENSNNEQKLSEINLTLSLLAQKIYDDPTSVAQTESVLTKLGLNTDFSLSDNPDEPFMPGAVFSLNTDAALDGSIGTIMNPEVLKMLQPHDQVLAIICHPRIDELSATKTPGIVKPVEIQKPDIILKPGMTLEDLPGIKQIILSEDYQFPMIDPATLS